MRIGNIRKIRKQCDKTLVQVAQETGLSASYISDLERGTGSNPSLTALEKLAQCYGVALSSLLDGMQKESAMQAESDRKAAESQNWYRCNMRYHATHHIVGEPGLEHVSIEEAINRGLSLCAGHALCPVRLVDVTTTVIPRSSEKMPFSIYVTVIAEPMIPPERNEEK